ncbi:acyl-CoA synthetase FdrA, partial [Salmonella enterica subsp. enterica serovar Infantis]
QSLPETPGLGHDEFHGAPPNDICVAIRTEAEDDGITQVSVQQLEEALQQLAQGSSGSQSVIPVRRWESACQKLPEATLALG